MAGLLSLFSKKEERVYTVDDEIRIVLLGKTGTGKSHTGNTILGDSRFESMCAASSITKKCKQQAAVRKDVDKNVILVDTPGLFDDQVGNEVTKQEVARCVGITAPGVHCFLLVVSIGRFSPEERNAVKEFFSMFGDHANKYMIILFTKIDTINPTDTKKNDQEKFAEYLKEVTGDLREIIEKCGNRCISFNNNAKDKKKKEQVSKLFVMINEMIQQNGGTCYTNEMYLETERKIQELFEKMKKEQEKKDELNQRLFEEKIRAEFREKMEKAEPGILTKIAGGIWDLVTLNWF